jgi:hypothetical protein
MLIIRKATVLMVPAPPPQAEHALLEADVDNYGGGRCGTDAGDGAYCGSGTAAFVVYVRCFSGEDPDASCSTENSPATM